MAGVLSIDALRLCSVAWCCAQVQARLEAAKKDHEAAQQQLQEAKEENEGLRADLVRQVMSKSEMWTQQAASQQQQQEEKEKERVRRRVAKCNSDDMPLYTPSSPPRCRLCGQVLASNSTAQQCLFCDDLFVVCTTCAEDPSYETQHEHEREMLDDWLVPDYGAAEEEREEKERKGGGVTEFKKRSLTEMGKGRPTAKQQNSRHVPAMGRQAQCRIPAVCLSHILYLERPGQSQRSRRAERGRGV